MKNPLAGPLAIQAAVLLLGLTMGNGAPAEKKAVAVTKNWTIPRGGNALQGRVADAVPRKPRVKWDAVLDGPIIGDAAIADGTVYIGTVMGTFYAINFETGKTRWKFETEDTIDAPPTVGLGRVFIGSSDAVIISKRKHSSSAFRAFFGPDFPLRLGCEPPEKSSVKS